MPAPSSSSRVRFQHPSSLRRSATTTTSPPPGPGSRPSTTRATPPPAPNASHSRRRTSPDETRARIAAHASPSGSAFATTRAFGLTGAPGGSSPDSPGAGRGGQDDALEYDHRELIHSAVPDHCLPGGLGGRRDGVAADRVQSAPSPETSAALGERCEASTAARQSPHRGRGRGTSARILGVDWAVACSVCRRRAASTGNQERSFWRG